MYKRQGQDRGARGTHHALSWDDPDQDRHEQRADDEHQLVDGVVDGVGGGQDGGGDEAWPGASDDGSGGRGGGTKEHRGADHQGGRGEQEQGVGESVGGQVAGQGWARAVPVGDASAERRAQGQGQRVAGEDESCGGVGAEPVDGGQQQGEAEYGRAQLDEKGGGEQAGDA